MQDDFVPPSDQWTDVVVHRVFKHGNSADPRWLDLAKLNNAELVAIQRFIFNILKKRDHEGSNKPSSMAGSLHSLSTPGAKIYADGAAWHLHCGPGYSRPGVVPTDWWLPSNTHGRESTEVIQYSKKQDFASAGQRLITIIGFSRTHVPFPDGASPSNPFRARLAKLDDAEPLV